MVKYLKFVVLFFIVAIVALTFVDPEEVDVFLSQSTQRDSYDSRLVLSRDGVGSSQLEFFSDGRVTENSKLKRRMSKFLTDRVINLLDTLSVGIDTNTLKEECLKTGPLYSTIAHVSDKIKMQSRQIIIRIQGCQEVLFPGIEVISNDLAAIEGKAEDRSTFFERLKNVFEPIVGLFIVR